MIALRVVERQISRCPQSKETGVFCLPEDSSVQKFRFRVYRIATNRRPLMPDTKSSGLPVRRPPNAPASRTNSSILIRYATVLPPIYSKPGADLRTLQMLRGHRVRDETTIYLHLARRQLSATGSPLYARTS